MTVAESPGSIIPDLALRETGHGRALPKAKGKEIGTAPPREGVHFEDEEDYDEDYDEDDDVAAGGAAYHGNVESPTAEDEEREGDDEEGEEEEDAEYDSEDAAYYEDGDEDTDDLLYAY